MKVLSEDEAEVQGRERLDGSPAVRASRGWAVTVGRLRAGSFLSPCCSF